RAVTARKPLILMSREPKQQAGQDPPCEAVTGDAEEQERLAALAPSSALRAPSPASGRRAGVAQGAQAGCAFFAPGFFAQAKKGGSRRHGAKALDLNVAGTGTAGGSRPALRGCYRRRRRARAARRARTLMRPRATFSRKREKGWRCAGRAGGVCLLCARFLCTSKERWLAPSRRESP